MENITQTVYNALEARTDEIAKVVTEREALTEKINSNRYTTEVLNREMYPKKEELTRKLRSMSYEALQEAKNLIEEYKAEVQKKNDLNPEEITDDIKLLQPGIVLTARDIIGIVERNKGNKTMEQIAIRYAQEHKIETGLYYHGMAEEMQTAKNIEGLLIYYERWIDKPNAKEMLRKFFNVE